MKRPDDYQRINIDVPRELWKRVGELSKHQGIDKKSIVTAALISLLQQHEKRNPTDV
ncbi:hypothetical protein NUL63_004573 [Salmonella enterica]|nr:hypothetical protein [Salmonella enterica]